MAEDTKTLNESTLRNRRKDKIMQSREDRLAKILSMASGRAIDPSEVHIDRTPSPTVSETAAAGVGTFPSLEKTSNDSDATTITTSSSLVISNSSTTSLASPNHTVSRGRISMRGLSRGVAHGLIVTMGGIAFVVWLKYVLRVDQNILSQMCAITTPQASHQPWHILIAVFIGMQTIEFFKGGLKLRQIPQDLALYLFVVVFLYHLCI